MNSGALFHCLPCKQLCMLQSSLLSRCSPYCAAFWCTILLTTLMQALALLSASFHGLFLANFTNLIKWRGRFWMSDVLMLVAAEIRLINSESQWHWRHWPGAVPLFALRINVMTNNMNSGHCTGDPLACYFVVVDKSDHLLTHHAPSVYKMPFFQATQVGHHCLLQIFPHTESPVRAAQQWAVVVQCLSL